MDENRIVLIRGNKSEWYEQAIFILKSPESAKGKNLVFEAERIINEYMATGGAGTLSPRLERYKKAVMERVAASEVNDRKNVTGVKTVEGVSAVQAGASNRPVSRTVVKRVDLVSVLLSAGLVLCSFLFGYLMHKVMWP